ncbi:bifunctional purine biosynthesis protein PurH [Elysia marginata]|uniref:Bifunctional purine biosynthesis protein ATIC n=1 Tax=Elysia marginata TaxID=1093978 RepID=A0AAV4G6U2_9GAST|nr:bifunctional purine biosynthesis protein PurH [Elysia marginata]
MGDIRIQSALISVYDKEGIEEVAKELTELGVRIYSTGGTQAFLTEKGFNIIAIEEVTDFPSVLGGRVKTLHPKVFGGILNRRNNENDHLEVLQYQMPSIDLVVVDLYPFEDTVASCTSEANIIEKIDIGGISLIRAAAKNFNDVLCIPSKSFYPDLRTILNNNKGLVTKEERRKMSLHSFGVSSHYDIAIFNYFNTDKEGGLRLDIDNQKMLRYGENPHQKGIFYGNLENIFTKHSGKEISYNNLLDIDAAVNLISDFDSKTPCFGIIKHNNACGFAVRPSVKEAYLGALSGDPVSAFGGVLVTNTTLDEQTAEEINKLFFEIIIAKKYEPSALTLLSHKKNRILLELKEDREVVGYNLRTCLNGFLYQEKDDALELTSHFDYVTNKKPSQTEMEDLIFASKIAKHTKSNAIILAKNRQLLASGTGQSSRVDALLQAIEKAKKFGFDLEGASMASDAFFPFADCVEIAFKEGIRRVIQPGGSKNDQHSIDFCNENNMGMVITGVRHFRH